ncbi:hypothetical protein DPMN_153797 [Dreissena polymorpha]|uniref:Uncharacterized protein n=1 Tax=Dreissena polymorpha TaxID=45954 RepID=A0A9D4FJT7_DREPO|nr:hypothetical protein DPMN_153797 [Dreissena polymorpha]
MVADTRVDLYPVTLKTTDDILQHQSPGIRHDGDRTLPSESRSTSDHMATTVSRSLPDGIGQGHRPMPDQLATAIRSFSGDYAGHFMTGTSPGTGPVTGDRSGQRPVTGHRGSVRSPVTGPTHRSPVNIDRSGHRSPVRPTGHRSTLTGPVTGQTHRSPVNRDRSGHRSPVRNTGHRSTETGPVTGQTHRSPVNGPRPVNGPVTGHRSTCTDQKPVNSCESQVDDQKQTFFLIGLFHFFVVECTFVVD